MDISALFAGLGAVCAIWYVVTSLMIYSALRKRNVKVNFFLLRPLIIKYAGQYKQITRKETGRIGPLFYHWIISINLALACAVVAMMAHLT